MVLKIDDWEFEVDFETMEKYSKQALEEHCTCGYCRNFYASVDWKYPNLRAFLKQFAIEIEAPDELSPYEPTACEAEYAVAGWIRQRGKMPISVDGLTVSVETESHINHGLQGSVFFLSVGLMELPWLLDEPMEEVVSPANEPVFLKKMWNKLLRKAEKINHLS